MPVWFVAHACLDPGLCTFDDPEIIILAFAYHGGEGGTVAAPIVARVMQAYFEIKSVDLAKLRLAAKIPCVLHAIICNYLSDDFYE